MKKLTPQTERPMTREPVDVVARLKTICDLSQCCDSQCVYQHAAAEIERLRQRVRELEKETTDSLFEEEKNRSIARLKKDMRP